MGQLTSYCFNIPLGATYCGFLTRPALLPDLFPCIRISPPWSPIIGIPKILLNSTSPYLLLSAFLTSESVSFKVRIAQLKQDCKRERWVGCRVEPKSDLITKHHIPPLLSPSTSTIAALENAIKESILKQWFCLLLHLSSLFLNQVCYSRAVCPVQIVSVLREWKAL